MHFNFKTKLDFFIFFVFFIKVVFVLSAIGHIVFSHSTSSASQNLDPKLILLKEQTEFIFIASMSTLLIYHFNPVKHIPINEETSVLFFIFGLVILLTAKWSLFITNSSFYHNIVSIFDLLSFFS